ncbi:hypothetical protein AX16_010668 [Volvariella volvacea WC 439]|nr:hypothetical protein AX16_010668 [Volvariella volvacea WC 439]
MLARLTRLSLRRCLHTQSTQPISHARFNRVGLGFAAGVVTSYFAWRMTSDHNRIALDSSAPLPAPASPSRKSTQANAPPAPSTPSSKESALEPVALHPQASTETSTDTSSPNESPIASEGSGTPPEEGDSHGSNSAAYNPITGEINWDCPCLGGMAHGPCGQEFREAFSCFVYSEDEPKGINCVDKFKAMQDCFRAHPDVYADEIMDDEDEEAPAAPTDTNALDESASNVPPTEQREGPTKTEKTHKKPKREQAPTSASSPEPVQA